MAHLFMESSGWLSHAETLETTLSELKRLFAQTSVGKLRNGGVSIIPSIRGYRL